MRSPYRRKGRLFSPHIWQRYPIIFIMGLFTCALTLRSFWRPKAQRILSIPISEKSSKTTSVPLLTITIEEIQKLMAEGELTSVELIEQCLGQIRRHDDYLRAIIQVAPTARDQALRLDKERSKGHIRGPLHGIPVLVKDNIATDKSLGMNTTAGSFALMESIPQGNAPIVQALIDAGAIILAKTNMAEFALYKGNSVSQAWSAVGGQGQSPYTRGDVDPSEGIMGHSNPGGSSTGSATGVSVGYAPFSIGTDTTGSVVIPATRNALYGMRVTHGLISIKRTVPVCSIFDTVGLMARTVDDLTIAMNALTANSKTQTHYTRPTASWRELRVGVLDPALWQFTSALCKPEASATKHILRTTEEAYGILKPLAASVKRVELISVDDLDMKDGSNLFNIFRADFRADIEEYLKEMRFSPVNNLADIVEFNKKHAAIELPPGNSDQELLVAALHDETSSQLRKRLVQHVTTMSRTFGIDKTLDDNDVDVIIGPADSAFSLLACASGYPSATMPLSYLDALNGRPTGLFALTRAGGEQMLLNVLKAWESTFPSRRTPAGY